MSRKQRSDYRSDPETDPEPVKRKSAEHRVAAGKSITTPRGVVGPGGVVTAADFGGADALAGLVAKGYIEAR